MKRSNKDVLPRRGNAEFGAERRLPVCKIMQPGMAAPRCTNPAGFGLRSEALSLSNGAKEGDPALQLWPVGVPL